MLRKPVIVVLILLALAVMACRAVTQSESRPESQPADPPEASGNSGQRLFEQLGCGECHNSVVAFAAPSLKGVYGSEVELEGGETVIADEAYLRESILSPGARVVDGYQPIMPDFQDRLSDEQVEALVEYIRSLGE